MCYPHSRHRSFLYNYFHRYENGHRDIILSFIERWFVVYDTLKTNKIENFVALDSDCLLLEDMTQHNYKKIGINIVSNAERCWANSLICSTTCLDQFLDFVCSFYSDLRASLGVKWCGNPTNGYPHPDEQYHQEKAEVYIDSFFKKAKEGICDMALWYLMYQKHPNLFINNLTIDSNDSVHDLVLGYDPKDPVLQKEYQQFTTQNEGGMEIRKVIHTEDGPCFEERESQKLIKAKSLHFSPGELKFKIKPFIEEYQTIYRKAL